MNITKNFSLKEIEHSDTALARGIDNTLAREQYPIMEEIVVSILQPLRDHLGPISINSGYRCPELNEAVGGVNNSQHVYDINNGAAVDIVARDHTTQHVMNTIIALDLSFDQCILEYPNNKNGGWVHVSTHLNGVEDNRYELLVKEKGTGYRAITQENEHGIHVS